MSMLNHIPFSFLYNVSKVYEHFMHNAKRIFLDIHLSRGASPPLCPFVYGALEIVWHFSLFSHILFD